MVKKNEIYSVFILTFLFDQRNMLQDLRVHTVASRHQYQHQQRQQHRRRLHRRQVTTMNYQHDRLFQRHYHHQTVKKKKIFS